jgi:teichuronic acid biosynthesis glycosyltransferase TuaC
MLRVLSITTLFPNAARPGFGLFVARQAQALARGGEAERIVINPVGIAPLPLRRFFNTPAELALPEAAHDWGVDVHYPRFLWLPKIGARWNPALIYRAVLPLARRLHAQHPFDVVDAQFFFPDGPAAARVATALGLPLSITARGSDIHMWGGFNHARRAMLRAADQASAMLAVSAALKQDMAALGMAADKIAVHYTGLDRALFYVRPRGEARKFIADLVPVDGPLLLCVGNLIPLKGQHLVIEALARLPGARLVLAGKGPEDSALRALAARLGLTDRVHFAGSVPPQKLAVLLAAADVMVLPSEREGLANAWIEALASGTPLVITDVGGAREVVKNRAAGRLAARNPAAIAKAAADILAAPPAAHDVAAQVAGFSWESNAAALAAHYRRLAGQV